MIDENQDEDNVQRIIDKVLSYHKHKAKNKVNNNPILKDNKQSAKIGLNKNLQLSKLTPT